MSEQLKIHKALADETRLRLMRLLSRGPLNVNEIIGILDMGQSRISRHLKILAEADLVTNRREGTWIYYQWNDGNGESKLLADTFATLAAHEGDLPRYEADLQGLEATVESRREQTRSFFDSIPDPHEYLQHQSLDGQFYRQVATSLLPERSEVALDMGSGSGLLIPSLLERAEKIIAVDSSNTMLDLARRTVNGDAARCDFRLGDLEHLPVADGEVDTVVACMVLHHLSDPAAALAEAHRALKPGGHIVIVDLHRHNDESLRDRHADLWLGFKPTDIERWLEKVDLQLTDSGIVSPELDANAAHSRADPGDRQDPERLKLITFKGQKPC